MALRIPRQQQNDFTGAKSTAVNNDGESSSTVKSFTRGETADQSNFGFVLASVPVTDSGVSKDEVQLDLAGQNILSLLHKAAGLAEGNSRYAVDIAQKLSDRLCAAENKVAKLANRISELEAEVQLYREKAERSEQWLHRISSEIEQQVGLTEEPDTQR